MSESSINVSTFPSLAGRYDTHGWCELSCHHIHIQLLQMTTPPNKSRACVKTLGLGKTSLTFSIWRILMNQADGWDGRKNIVVWGLDALRGLLYPVPNHSASSC